MRFDAAHLSRLIAREVIFMNRRKEYIQSMTTYLNERIRELNAVKADLEQEMKWIMASNKRIEELREREKLVKLQDVLNCMNSDTNKLNLEAERYALRATCCSFVLRHTAHQLFCCSTPFSPILQQESYG